jgi:putative ABC transport system permease protein
LLAYGVGFILLAALLFWKARDFKLGAYVIGGFGAALLIAMCAGGLLVWLVGQARGRARGPWRYGLANVNRRAAGSIVQIVALGLGIMALLLLTLVRGDLLRSWENKVPLDAPNRFVVSIQPDQVEPVKRFFDSHRLRQVELYPAVRGRLRAINGQPISSASFEDPRMKRLVEREFNLTSAKDLRVDNRVVAGNWRADASPPEFSMEEWIAQQLGVHIGDKVYFDVAGTSLGATVTSVRKVDWDSFKVNFYLIASPGALQGLPTSYLTSFYLPPGREGVLNALIRSFPNLTVIDVAQIMARFRAMTEQVAHAVQFVFVFTLGAGLIVLYAAINATQDERMFESAVMRAVGASRRQLMLTHLAEFGALGLAAGVLGAAGASAISFALSVKVFSFAYHFNPWILAWGALGGLFGVACAGLLGMRGTLTRAPLEIMRKFT